MRPTRITFILALATVVVVTLSIVARGDDASGDIRLSLDDDGASIKLGESGTLTLELEANPTTGFTWRLESLDEQVLRLSGEPAYRSHSNLPGSPGTMTFAFEAAGAGETELRLVYHRPWEDAAPIQTFDLLVTVG